MKQKWRFSRRSELLVEDQTMDQQLQSMRQTEVRGGNDLGIRHLTSGALSQAEYLARCHEYGRLRNCAISHSAISPTEISCSENWGRSSKALPWGHKRRRWRDAQELYPNHPATLNQDPQPKATANAAMENAEKAQRNSTCPCHLVIAPEKLLSCHNPHWKIDTSPSGMVLMKISRTIGL